jgi:hypothetical protein
MQNGKQRNLFPICHILAFAHLMCLADFGDGELKKHGLFFSVILLQNVTPHSRAE